MSNLELVFNMLGEVSSTEIMKEEESIGFEKVREASEKGGKVAGVARKQLEKVTKKSIIGEKALGKDTKSLKEKH